MRPSIAALLMATGGFLAGHEARHHLATGEPAANPDSDPRSASLTEQQRPPSPEGASSGPLAQPPQRSSLETLFEALPSARPPLVLRYLSGASTEERLALYQRLAPESSANHQLLAKYLFLHWLEEDSSGALATARNHSDQLHLGSFFTVWSEIDFGAAMEAMSEEEKDQYLDYMAFLQLRDKAKGLPKEIAVDQLDLSSLRSGLVMDALIENYPDHLETSRRSLK